MTEQQFKPKSTGFFEAIGTITVTPESTFQTDLKGSNNQDFIYNKINLQMEDDDGNKFFINAVDGYNAKKGRIIYANIKDSPAFEQMQVNFADRFNEEILKHIDNRSFVSIALRKVKNEEGKDVWEYNNFLTLFDAINFIKPRFETGMKLRITGRTGYRTYNDRLQRDFNIQNIYLLSEENDQESKFTFKQNVLLTDKSVNLDEWEEKGIAQVDAKLYTISYDKETKSKYAELLTLPLTVRSNDDNKDKVKRMIDKFLTVDDDKVRRIRLEGKYNIGYVAGKLTEDDLPQEALELIQDGIYSKDEVLNIFVNRDRVDEMTVIRPVINIDKDSNKPKVDYSDDEYKLDDIINLKVEAPKKEEEIVVSDIDEDLTFLDELD